MEHPFLATSLVLAGSMTAFWFSTEWMNPDWESPEYDNYSHMMLVEELNKTKAKYRTIISGGLTFAFVAYMGMRMEQ